MSCPCHCSEAAYGELLAPYLDDPSNLFIISSDFCHWGMRFNYTHYKQSVVSGAQWVQSLRTLFT